MRLCQALDDFSTVDEARLENNNFDDEYDLEVEKANASEPSQPNDENVLKLNPCCVCLDEISQITLIPCGHLKVCIGCWTTLKNVHDEKIARFVEHGYDDEHRPALKCPFCNKPVENFLTKTFT